MSNHRRGEFESIWSPDSSRVVFNPSHKRHFDPYQKASCGAGTEEVLLEGDIERFFASLRMTSPPLKIE